MVGFLSTFTFSGLTLILLCFTQEEGWVVCRVFKKRMTAVRKMGEYDSPCWYDDQVGFMPELDSPRQVLQQYASAYRHQRPCKQELELQYNNMPHHDALFLQLPQLESPNSVAPYVYERNNSAGSNFQTSTLTEEEHMQQVHHQSLSASVHVSPNEQAQDQVTDWRLLDKFVASQLSNDNAGNPEDYSNPAAYHVGNQMDRMEPKKPSVSQGYVLASSSRCQIELWK